MTEMCRAMIAVLGTWGACMAVLLGIGLLVRTTLRFPSVQSGLDILCSIWTGFAFAILGALLWHFILPVDAVLTTVMVIIGIVGLGLGFKSLMAAIARTWREQRMAVLIIILFAIWTANRALGEGGYDDTLYEWQSIKWIHAYAIVPGLGNLNHRFAFNNAHHLYCALLSVGMWNGRVNHIYNGLFIILLAAQIIRGISKCFAKQHATPADTFATFFVSPCIAFVLFGMMGPMLASLKADEIISAMACVMAMLYMETFTARSTNGLDPGNVGFIRFSMAALAAVSVTIKLSAIIFSGLVILLALLPCLRAKDASGKREKKIVICSLAFCALIFAAWSVRGVLLSGYPLYPSRIISWAVAWRMPPAIADGEKSIVKLWGRNPDNPFAFPENSNVWIGHWLVNIFNNDRFSVLLPILLFTFQGVALAVWLFAIKIKRPQISQNHGIGLILAAMAALTFWFINAPTTRFGFSFFWIMAASLFCMVLNLTKETLASKEIPGLALAFYVAGCAGLSLVICFIAIRFLPLETRAGFLKFWIIATGLALALGAGIFFRRMDSRVCVALLIAIGFFQVMDRGASHLLHGRFKLLAAEFITPPGVDHGFHGPPDESAEMPMRQFTTNSGLVVYDLNYYKARGIWPAPLPSTFQINPYLRLIRPNDLSSGFINTCLDHNQPTGYDYYANGTQ